MLKLNLNHRQLCDLELLINGGFSPLSGFLNKDDYLSVLKNMRLASGDVWPMPIMLDVSADFVDLIDKHEEILLCDCEGTPLATLDIGDIWCPDKENEAQSVFATTECSHPGVNYLLNEMGPYYVGGRVIPIKLPQHFDFNELRLSPQELKQQFKDQCLTNIVAFQTRNPMHRAHVELTLRAAKIHDAHVLIHPVVGLTKPGDIDHYTRVRCYKKIAARYPRGMASLSLLPIAMRMAGPREALWHALIRKNYGCTHFIIGRDHAGPGKDQEGKPFYHPYAAQELVRDYESEIGIKMVPFQEMVYIKECGEYKSVDEVSEEETALRISGTEFRRCLHQNKFIPEWFSYPDVIDELRKTIPLPHERGLTLFFTGLSGAGKSTLAKALQAKLLSRFHRPITILDGDLVRCHLSSELGFSKEHRDLNVKRIGFVAAEITKHGGIAICAPIAPYAKTRDYVRSMVSHYGYFIEVHVATSLSVCEQRDTKGLYRQARLGHIKGFTGIDDPYEDPQNAELVFDTEKTSVSDLVDKILHYLSLKGITLVDDIDKIPAATYAATETEEVL